MKLHAHSQVSDAEALRLRSEALTDRVCQVTLVDEDEQTLFGTRLIRRWSFETPNDGRIHRLALIDIDDEGLGFDVLYRDESDAIAVWRHLVQAYAASLEGPVPPTDGPAKKAYRAHRPSVIS